MSNMHHLSKDLPAVAKKALGKKFDRAIGRLVCYWPEIVGPRITKMAVPLDIKFSGGGRQNTGTLYLGVNSAFAPEIQHMTPVLIEKINTYLGRKVIADIRLIDIDSAESKSERLARKYRKKPPPVTTPKQKMQIEAELVGIEDEELKKALEKFGRAILSENA